MVMQDNLNELFSKISEVTAILDNHLGNGFKGELDQEHFIRWFDKSRKIDPRSTFFWIQKNKNKFNKNMLKYAQSFYKKAI